MLITRRIERMVMFNMSNENALWEDMRRLNALYEELCWGYDDELVFTHDGKRIVIYNKTRENA
jgi:hypothetical protein